MLHNAAIHCKNHLGVSAGKRHTLLDCNFEEHLLTGINQYKIRLPNQKTFHKKIIILYHFAKRKDNLNHSKHLVSLAWNYHIGFMWCFTLWSSHASPLYRLPVSARVHHSWSTIDGQWEDGQQSQGCHPWLTHSTSSDPRWPLSSQSLSSWWDATGREGWKLHYKHDMPNSEAQKLNHWSFIV